MSHSLSLSHILTLSLILLSLIKTFVFLVQERLVDSTALNLQIKIHCFLDMKSQPKFIQDALPLCHRHLRFQFLLQNLVRIFYPPVMLLSFIFFLILVLIFLLLTFRLLFERKFTCTFYLMTNFISYSHLLLWTHTQYSSLYQKPFLLAQRPITLVLMMINSWSYVY